MAETKTYWQIIMEQVNNLTNTITNSLGLIMSMFSRSGKNAVLHNAQQRPQDGTTNTSSKWPTTFSKPLPSSKVMREIVAGYRRGLARHLSINTFPGESIFGTITDVEESDLSKLEREAYKAEKEMLVTTLTVARMQIAQMTKHQKELEHQIMQLQDAFKLPELDMGKFSYDFSDIPVEEDSPKTNIPQDVKELVISPRSMKSKLPRPIPIKPKKQLNDAQLSPKAMPTR